MLSNRFQGRFWDGFRKALTLLAIVTLGFAIAQQSGLIRPKDRLAGQRLPDFRLPNIQLDGDTFTLEDLKGKAVLMTFWSTTCGPCRDEIPLLKKLHEEFAGRGLVVLGVTDDAPGTARAFAERNKMTYPLVFDHGGRLGGRFDVRAIPYNVFVAPDGTIAGDVTGTLSEAEARRRLEPLLAQALTP